MLVCDKSFNSPVTRIPLRCHNHCWISTGVVTLRYQPDPEDYSNFVDIKAQVGFHCVELELLLGECRYGTCCYGWLSSNVGWWWWHCQGARLLL